MLQGLNPEEIRKMVLWEVTTALFTLPLGATAEDAMTLIAQLRDQQPQP